MESIFVTVIKEIKVKGKKTKNYRTSNKIPICYHLRKKRNEPWTFASTTCVSPPLDRNQMNNAAHTATLLTQLYPAVGPLTSPYEPQQPVQDFNTYATLKAVGKKLFTMSHYVKRSRLSFII